jgi:hypothetical protein
MVPAGFENITQPPGTILPDLNAHIDMVRSQIRTLRRRWNVMNMTIMVDPSSIGTTWQDILGRSFPKRLKGKQVGLVP